MEWIRRTFLFNRKNKSNEKEAISGAGVATDKFDDEFIDIFEETKPAEPKTATEEKAPDESINKPTSDENVCDTSETDQSTAASTEPRQMVSKKPRPAKKPICNNQQPNAQLRNNNIIHQPR